MDSTELPAQLLNQLQPLSSVSDASFTALLDQALADAVGEDVTADSLTSRCSDITASAVRQLHAALLALFLRCVSHAVDATALQRCVTTPKLALTPQRAAELTRRFEEQRAACAQQLQRVGYRPDEVVDVHWQETVSGGRSTFLVCLQTRVQGAQDTKDVRFVCDRDQLQDLVTSLREAVGSLEKLAASSTAGSS